MHKRQCLTSGEVNTDGNVSNTPEYVTETILNNETKLKIALLTHMALWRACLDI